MSRATIAILLLVSPASGAEPRAKSVIGASETIAVVLPTVDEGDVRAEFRARIDTGAATSSIHAEDITVEGIADPNPKRNVGKRVTFTATVGDRDVAVRAVITDSVVVRTSEGAESRYKIVLRTTVDGRAFLSKYTLNDRSKMTFPVLVGRNALRGRFVVDVEKK